MNARVGLTGSLAAPLAAGLILIGVPLGIIGLAGATTAPPPVTDCPALRGRTVAHVQLDATQRADAATIVATTAGYTDHDRPLPPRAAVVALATAYTESRLYNLGYGDRDSIGLFQQRVSIYGRDVAADPVRSTRAFLDHLIAIDGWQQLPVTVAAAKVQRPAAQYRDRYAAWAGLARTLTIRLWPTSHLRQRRHNPGPRCAATSCPPSGLTIEHGLAADAVAVIRCVHSAFPAAAFATPRARQPAHGPGTVVDIDPHPDRAEHGRPELVRWLHQHASGLGIKSVGYRGDVWTAPPTAQPQAQARRGPRRAGSVSLRPGWIRVAVYGHAGTGLSAWVLPVRPGNYVLTSRYGPREDPTGPGSDFHTGLDFAAPTGTPIRAAVAGVVTSAGLTGGYGNLLIITSPDGVATYYAHQQPFGITVTLGQHVVAGERVGTVGATGNVTGPHLHFEVRLHGHPTNPYSWLVRHGLHP